MKKLELIHNGLENSANIGISNVGLGTHTVYVTKILLPNIDENNNNFLLQKEVSNQNYKYVIKYNFDLNGQTITIPAGCIIEFDGGTLNNGTLKVNNSTIVNLYDYTIMNNVTISGAYKLIKGLITQYSN